MTVGATVVVVADRAECSVATMVCATDEDGIAYENRCCWNAAICADAEECMSAEFPTLVVVAATAPAVTAVAVAAVVVRAADAW